MNKELYLIYATTDSSGLVLNEIFENMDDALEFEKNEVKKQLLANYGEKMVNCKSLQIGFGKVPLHTNTLRQ